jgi:hypothetical protein
MVDIESAASIDKHRFLTEAFPEFAIATAVLVVRIFARTKAVGFRGWQGDDYFGVLCILFWIVSLARCVFALFPRSF